MGGKGREGKGRERRSEAATSKMPFPVIAHNLDPVFSLPPRLTHSFTSPIPSPHSILSLRRKEADTPSEGSLPSTDESDLEWKEERGLGGDGDSSEDEKKDDAVSGMVPADGGGVMVAEIPVTVDERSVGFANSDEVKMGDGAIVNRPSISQGIIIRPLTGEGGAGGGAGGSGGE